MAQGTSKNAGEGREKIAFKDNDGLLRLFGPSGKNLKVIQREMGLKIHNRGNELVLVGDPGQIGLARSLLSQLHSLVRRGRDLDAEDLVRAARVLNEDPKASIKEIFTDTVLVTPTSYTVTPKGIAQKRYVDAMREHDIVFGIGPAGTGKTYLAMGMAVSALLKQQVKRIVLTRPAVEAGEKLGFLPGDLVEKVNPYLRPLYEALNDMMEFNRAQQMMEQGQIEVAPLAFMRGRTLNNSFVILDEAQNSTAEQMLMFLTRLGYDSNAVITGDVTQIDLPTGCRSGLQEAEAVLGDVDGISFCHFTERDVVRHQLVQKIILAYEKRNRAQQDS